MSLSLLPGAEPLSHVGSRVGVLALHGFTGSPSSMRPVANAMVAAGYSVELPRLPGHGTTVEEMMTTGWLDWSGEVTAAYERLRVNADTVVVAGLSMGGSLALWLAGRHPELAGVICVNPKVLPEGDEAREMVQGMIDEGDVMIPGIGSDIAKPGVVESAYPGTPLPPVLEMWRGLDQVGERLANCAMPLLLMTSTEDHVVPPAESDHLATVWAGPVERVSLSRSYHVATLDYDADLVIASALGFVARLTA
jgi:carboxylesterase